MNHMHYILPFVLLGAVIAAPEGNRIARDVMEDFKSAAMMGAGEAMSTFQKGVGFEDTASKKFNFFGTEVGGSGGYKLGFGDAIRDKSPDSGERRRREASPDVFMAESEDSVVILMDDAPDYSASASESSSIIIMETSRQKRSPCRGGGGGGRGRPQPQPDDNNDDNPDAETL